MYYLHLDDFHIVGASIETLVKVEDGYIENHPIAGTRPRGKTPEEDRALEEELKGSEKQQAEHIMLVDLGRNDVGRVSVPAPGHSGGFVPAAGAKNGRPSFPDLPLFARG